ncbi:MAG: methyltransferase domain-containing protein, partial [Desulfamplus sp.]|nr:methyltransferase domain-containing protein [Desulfamplus sp.]
NLLAQEQQGKTENGELIAMSCLNVAWILTDDEQYREAIEKLKAKPINKQSEKAQFSLPVSLSTINNPIIFDDTEPQLTQVIAKYKIIFFVKKGMDSFIGDIINGLSLQYESKKIIITNYNQVDQEMQWADICWFEWCDDLIIYASKLEGLKEKKVICRLHSYEAFTDYPTKVNWDNVDIIIFVAKHICNIVLEQTPSLNKEKAVIIPNGIDLRKYHFKNRKPGFKIAYLGYINYKKGPMLLLHTFKAIHDSDSRYKLYIAGTFQDTRDILYYRQMINEMGLTNSVFHDGWQDDVDKWLEDKNYIICTSVLESQNLSVMQAMAKGIKPLVHNFVGAKSIYLEEYVWNTIPECIKILHNKNYNSTEYRNFIKDNYSLEKQSAILHTTLENLQYKNSKVNYNKKTNLVDNEKTETKNRFNYAAYWNNRLNRKFDIEGVGYIGLGVTYNKYLYKTRFDILDYILNNIFPKGLKKRHVLELGPGIGLFTDYFYKQRVIYEAIDIAKKSVKELKILYKEYSFIEGDISNPLLFKKNHYDLIFAADVLLHITDEDNYKVTVENISNALKEKGYAILFDPISVINTQSPSEHVIIRDIKYIKKIFADNGLEVINMLPCAFFMNYPFDKELIQGKERVATIFALIQNFFGSKEADDKQKSIIAQWLFTSEKLCLSNYHFGLSQKVIIAKKKINNYSFELSINKVWNKNELLKEYNVNNKHYSNLVHNSSIGKLNSIVHLDRLISELLASYKEDDALTVDYLNKTNEDFIPFNSSYTDQYDFKSGYKILLGKKEKITTNLELIEFIIENREKHKFLFFNIWHDITTKQTILPNYLSESSANGYFINEAIKSVIDLDVEYTNNIGGFINDEKILADVQKNQIIYNWERGIPATQFAPARGFLIIIERYKFAGNYIKLTDTILEAASGFGYGAAYLSKFANHVNALDIAQDNIDFGKSSYRLPNITWKNGDVTQLPYNNDYFDIYISFETMEHLNLDTIDLYISEGVRVLKKGGKMFISTPNREMRTNVHNPFHIKEYSFFEFDNVLRHHFSEISYFSVLNYKVLNGFQNKAFDMIAVCCKA